MGSIGLFCKPGPLACGQGRLMDPVAPRSQTDLEKEVHMSVTMNGKARFKFPFWKVIHQARASSMMAQHSVALHGWVWHGNGAWYFVQAKHSQSQCQHFPLSEPAASCPGTQL